MAFNKQKALEAARKFRDKGQRDRAIKEYLKVVREDPKDVRVWLKIGDLYAQKGAKAEATETYIKVAKFYSEQGFYLKAVAVYKQILKLDARMVEVNLKLAELYRQLGLVSDAMQHFETVAAFFHREGKTKEALATIRQLVDLDPENVATRIKLAELYSKEEMVEDAVTEFQTACDYLKRNGREDDYVKVAERLLWHKPERIELARELAALYLQRRDPRRALQKLQACFKADPRDVETLALLAQAFQALEQKGKTVSVLKELARVLTENGQRSQAEEVHRKILAYVPDDPDSLSFVGQKPAGRTPSPRPRADRLASIADAASMPGQNKPTGSVPIVEERSDAISPNLSLNAEPNLADGSSASAEVHADEIVKILTETDVYVKYGLHQKAVHHLRRIFDLDPGNVEARERLKDIYRSQGRERDAIIELTTLAEVVGATEPARAEGYLREILDLDANNQGAIELVHRYSLDISKVTTAALPAPLEEEVSEAIEFDLDSQSGSHLSGLDDALDFGDLDIEDGAVAAPEPGYRAPETLDPDAFDDLEISADSELTARAPSAGEEMSGTYEPLTHRAPSSLSFDEEEVVAEATMELRYDQAIEELDFDQAPAYAEPASFEARPRADSLEDRLDAALADEDLAIGERPTATGTTESVASNPFESTQDMDLADMAADSGIEEIHDISDFSGEVHDISDFGGELLEDSDQHLAVEEVEPVSAELSAEEYIESSEDLSLVPDPTQEVRVDNILEEVHSDAGALENDLDEADFYISQGLLEEARDILVLLQERYAGHPLVAAKLVELEDAEAAQIGGAPDIGDLDAGVGEIFSEDSANKPQVVVGNEVDESDAATHFDLGQAYREMGLLDEAVKEFQKVLALHSRQVQCHLMIGLCYRDQDKLSEAITQFKSGLYVANINEPEKFGLYYEIGISYESLSDPQEALYYYEMLAKKDPDYRDVAQRVANIRGSSGDKRKSTLDGDTDAALDGLAVKD